MGDEQLIRILNSFTPSQYADFLNKSPVTLDYVNKIGYEHPSVMKSTRANNFAQTNEQFLRKPTDVYIKGNPQGADMPVFMQQQTNNPVTQNLGMSSPRPGIPHPLAPSARVSPGGQLISPTPPALDEGFKGYPYAGDVTPEQFTFQPSDVATGRTTAYGSGLPQYTSTGMVDPTFSPSASASAQQASNQAVADSISKSDSGGFTDLQTAGMYYGANVATDALINTHDRKKVDTPFGNKGSQGGIVKGGIKGALLGAQLSGGNPYATAGGAIVGAYSGTQGGFDTETPPSYQVVGVRRRQGGGGLLAPKGMYG